MSSEESNTNTASATEPAEDDGISRCGISGLYDANGNPAALASGWLQAIEKNGKKRHRYYVLCPTYLAYFASEEHAAISEEGFMQGDADYTSISSFGSTGAQVHLSNIYSCEPDPLGEPTFLITYRKPLDDGTNAMQLACANKEIARGWSDAIMGQTSNHNGITPPNRTKAAIGPTVEDMAREAATKAAVAAMKSMRNLAAETKKGGLSGLMNGLAVSLTGWGNNTAEPVRQDNEYIAFCPWDERGIDLQSKAGKTCLEDELGHPAAVMHGWLTKKNKSGLRVGQGEKERYFVLTPLALTFFPDERVAAVKDGYLYGKAVGERIGGLFEKTGAFLPLESVCEIKLLARIDESNQMKRLSSGSNRSISSSSRRDSDDEEEDDEESPKKPSARGSNAAAQKKKKSKGSDDDDDDSDDDSKKKKTKPKKKKDDSDDDDDDSDDDRKKKKTKPKKKKDDSDDDDDDDSDDDRKKKKSKPKKKKDDSDDEDEEDEKPTKPKPKGEKPSAPKPSGSKPPGKPTGDKPKPLSSSSTTSSTSSTTALKPEGPPPSNLIEIDFGEFSLIVNAHNPKNRTAWVTALRKWSGWRKRNVDEEMLANFGT